MIQQLNFWRYSERNEIRVLRYLSKDVHNSILNNKPKGEATQVFIGEWMNKIGYEHTIEYYSALKKKILTHATS